MFLKVLVIKITSVAIAPSVSNKGVKIFFLFRFPRVGLNTIVLVFETKSAFDTRGITIEMDCSKLKKSCINMLIFRPNLSTVKL